MNSSQLRAPNLRHGSVCDYDSSSANRNLAWACEHLEDSQRSERNESRGRSFEMRPMAAALMILIPTRNYNKTPISYRVLSGRATCMSASKGGMQAAGANPVQVQLEVALIAVFVAVAVT